MAAAVATGIELLERPDAARLDGLRAGFLHDCDQVRSRILRALEGTSGGGVSRQGSTDHLLSPVRATRGSQAAGQTSMASKAATMSFGSPFSFSGDLTRSSPSSTVPPLLPPLHASSLGSPSPVAGATAAAALASPSRGSKAQASSTQLPAGTDLLTTSPTTTGFSAVKLSYDSEVKSTGLSSSSPKKLRGALAADDGASRARRRSRSTESAAAAAGGHSAGRRSLSQAAATGHDVHQVLSMIDRARAVAAVRSSPKRSHRRHESGFDGSSPRSPPLVTSFATSPPR